MWPAPTTTKYVAAEEIGVDFREPVLIAHVDQASGQGRKVLKRLSQNSVERLDVPTAPCVNHGGAWTLASCVDEQDQQQSFRFAVAQVHEKGVMLFR